MIETPWKHFEAIAKAGGDSVTVHYEACDDLPGVIAQARALGLGAGVAFNPETEPDAVAEAAGELVDLVLCMSIHPGYSGQPFMQESIPRIRRLRELLPDEVFIQVDGGVGQDNVRDLREAGASLLVAGTSVFGQEDIAAAYRDLAGALMLERALELAERGRGTTHPNPVVGAVVERDGEVVGEGWHERKGGPHAEVVALEAAGEAARGATLYVTLEPCDHHGTTPPCVDAILAAGIAKVVVGAKDPLPRRNRAPPRERAWRSSSSTSGRPACRTRRG